VERFKIRSRREGSRAGGSAPLDCAYFLSNFARRGEYAYASKHRATIRELHSAGR